MRIKLEMEMPRWLNRAILVSLPLGIVAITAWVFADVPNSFKPGEPVSAQKMNENFTALQVAIKQAVPAGTVVAFAGLVVPDGWLLCDGRSVSQAAYPALFAAISTVHGAGTDTFNLPDYRGRFLRGVDKGTGRDPDAASRTAAATGGLTGDQVGSVQGDTLQGHWHHHVYKLGALAAYDADNVTVPYPSYPPGPSDDDSIKDPVTDTKSGSPRTSAETRPVNVSVNYIIKY